jgi:hypothetical protein
MIGQFPHVTAGLQKSRVSDHRNPPRHKGISFFLGYPQNISKPLVSILKLSINWIWGLTLETSIPPNRQISDKSIADLSRKMNLLSHFWNLKQIEIKMFGSILTYFKIRKHYIKISIYPYFELCTMLI